MCATECTEAEKTNIVPFCLFATSFSRSQCVAYRLHIVGDGKYAEDYGSGTAEPEKPVVAARIIVRTGVDKVW